jgi:MscS family membrane protein
MELTIDYLEQQFFMENSLFAIFKFVAILLLGLLFKRLGAKFLSNQSFRIFKKFAHNQFSEVFLELLKKPFERVITLAVIYLAFHQLKFPESWELAHHSEFGIRWMAVTVYKIFVVYHICIVFLRTTDFFTYVLQNRDEAPVSRELSNFLKELIKVMVVILFLFGGLRFVFNVNITALVASLGIGGLAIALAAQDTLANLIASFIIYIDKPFQANDLVDFDGINGRIEHVGFRTTRIRTLDRSLVTVPNKKLIDTALNNVTMSESRRIRFSIGLTYGSKPEQLKNIISEIKETITRHPKTAEEYNVRFNEFNSSSLDILVLYFVMSNDYDEMIEVKEEINFQIMNIVQKNGCSFAFPTQSLYVESLPKNKTAE